MNHKIYNFNIKIGSMKQNLLPMILVFCLTSILVIANNDTHPTSLISTSQTHYIHNGSYFQYTFTSMKL